MSNLFAVQIGKTSRRGSFVADTTRYAESDATDSVIASYFREQYKGFDVSVTKAEKVLMIAPPVIELDGREYFDSKKTIEEQAKTVTTITHLSNLEVNISEVAELKPLYAEAVRLRSEHFKAEEKLKEVITKDISRKEWVSYLNTDKITIDYRWHKAKISSVRLDFDVIVEKTTDFEDTLLEAPK